MSRQDFEHYPAQPYNAFLDTVVASKSAYALAFGSLTFWDSTFDQTFTLVVDTGQLMMDGVSFQDRFNTNTTGGLQRFDGIKEGGTNNSALLAFRSSNANTRTRIDGIASGVTIEATSDGFATVGGGIGVTSSGVAITGLQSFTGTSTPGLQLKSLTTAQINTLASASALPVGSILVDSTTDRIDARLARGTVELVDTAGGQTIGGALQLNGTLNLRNLSGPTVTLTWNGNDRSGSALFNGSTIQNNGTRPAFQTAASTLDGAQPDFAAFNDNLTVQYFGLYKKSGTPGVMQVKSGPSTFASVELANLTASGTVLTTGQVRGASVWFGGVSQANTKLYGSASGQLFIYNSAESAGVMIDVNSNSAAFRNLANNADAPITCSNLTASGTVTANAVSTNTIQRASGTATIVLFNGLVTTPIFAVTIPGGGNTLMNSSGIAGELSLSATINQTGTAGSTNLLINRTETALGSGAHNFANFQVGGVTRFRVTNAGSMQVGSTGTLVTSILSATATLDFPSISSNDTHTLTITVTGAVAGDSVFLGVPATLEAGLIFCASVTAANTVTIRMHNSSGGSTDPASGTFRATVIRF